MIKRSFALLAIILFISNISHAAIIQSIKTRETPDKLRLVITLDKPAKYSLIKNNLETRISINNTKLKPNLQKNIPTKILGGIALQQKGASCEVIASYKYLTSTNVTALSKPTRIVLDFHKISNMQIPRTQAPEIQKIETRSLPDKFKIILSLTSFMPYKITTSETGVIVEIPDMNSVIKNQKITTKDKLIPKVAIDQIGKSTFISISQSYPAFYQIYKAENPTMLVIEFDKASKSTLAMKEVYPGLQYIKSIKGTTEGPSTVNVLIVDQTTFEVFPYIAVKPEEAPNIWGAIGNVFTFWSPKEETKYCKDKVSNMAWDSSAIAGINGTFFGSQGEPLGILMINGELISYSINDRTALIITKSNQCYIDNISLVGDVSVEDTPLQISGINRKRQVGEVIVYTPRFGNQTEEDSPGTTISVIDGRIKDIGRVRGWIPKDGYALSIDPTYYSTIADKMKLGTNIALTLKLIPLSAIPNLQIKHVVGGGPRLLKSGQIYISKNSEKFRNDVANSRASRSAVGITKGGFLAFVTVDKCKLSTTSAKSVGVTLEELAQIMKEVGCVDAMNLDGGGSSTMVLNSEIMNSPSNGKEIAVSNAILIKK